MKRILITGGPTNEAIDEVMTITNMSTGSLSCDFAKTALDAGCAVTLIFHKSVVRSARFAEYGLDSNPNVKLVSIDSCQDMYDALKAEGECGTHYDVIIHAAAVGDYKADFSFRMEDMAAELAEVICGALDGSECSAQKKAEWTGQSAHKITDGIEQSAHRIADGIEQSTHRITDEIEQSTHRITDEIEQSAHRITDGIEQSAHRITDGTGQSAQNGAAQTDDGDLAKIFACLNKDVLEALILKTMTAPRCKVNDDTKISSYEPNLTVKLTLTTKLISNLRNWFPDAYLVGCKLLENVTHEHLWEVARKLCIKNHMDVILANDLAELRHGQLVRYFCNEKGFTGVSLTQSEMMPYAADNWFK